MKQARTGVFTDEPFYNCQCNWPEDCFVQAGDNGFVVKRVGGSYRTAFFEAFPQDVQTFIRGEGKTIEEAERKAWEKYLGYVACTVDHDDPHNFERRDYRNGSAFCKSCGMFRADCFEPLEKCHNCGTATYYSADRHKRFWCEKCIHLLAEEDMSEVQKILRKARKEWREINKKGSTELPSA